jgi:hypothetical protein
MFISYFAGMVSDWLLKKLLPVLEMIGFLLKNSLASQDI